jgi:hypothetical protein
MARKRRKPRGSGQVAAEARREATAAARARRTSGDGATATARRAPAAASARRRGGRPRLEDRPKPPWHPVPLVELCVLVGLILLVLGAIDLGSDRGKLLLVCGMALGSLGGADTALREHFAGYRSHTTLLSGPPGVLAAAALYFVGVPWLAIVAGAAVVFVAVFWALRRAFLRRAARR